MIAKIRTLTPIVTALTAFVAATGLVVGPAPHAGADSSGQPTPEIAGEVIGPGADATILVPEAEIDRARNEAADETEAELTNTEERAQDMLLDASERSGGTLTEDSVDAFSLVDGDVVVAMPVTIDIAQVKIDVDDGYVDVSVVANEVETPLAQGSGPGMAPFWGNDGDGDYALIVKGMGDALFKWERDVLRNDGSSAYTWYSYKRKGDAHPFERSGPNARVAKLRVQSYPYDQIEKGLLNWVDWEPASDFSGNEGAPVTLSVSALGIGTVVTFADRDKYKVWRNPNNPGSYWIEMDQGRFIDSGSRSAGYAVVWKAKQGTPGSQHDFQRVVFFYNSGDYYCDEYDAGDTCTPNGVDH